MLREGEADRGLLVGDLDRRGLGRVKELKSRFSSNLSSFFRTRKFLLWLTTVSSGLGELVSILRDGESERGLRLGLSERRPALCVLL